MLLLLTFQLQDLKQLGYITAPPQLSSLYSHLFTLNRKALKFLLPYAHGAVALREASKSVLIKRCHEIRLAYRALADQLCRDGFLPDPDLIFYLTHHEIRELLEQRSPTLLQK